MSKKPYTKPTLTVQGNVAQITQCWDWWRWWCRPPRDWGCVS